MKAGDLVRWVGMYHVIGVVISFCHDYYDDDKYVWVILTDGRKELFDLKELEVINEW